jgi:hypothetical protein
MRVVGGCHAADQLAGVVYAFVAERLGAFWRKDFERHQPAADADLLLANQRGAPDEFSFGRSLGAMAEMSTAKAIHDDEITEYRAASKKDVAREGKSKNEGRPLAPAAPPIRRAGAGFPLPIRP